MKCDFFNLAVATPDAMVDTPLRSPTLHHNTKATNAFLVLDKRLLASFHYFNGGGACM